MSTATSTATSIRHRYAWTVEERVILAFFLLTPSAVTVWLSRGSGVDVVLAVVLHVAGLAAAAALYRLGARRKDRSVVTAELRGTRLDVSGGRVKTSRGDVAGTREVTTDTLGPETVLVLVGTSVKPLLVPMRIAGHPALAPVLREHLLRPGVALSDDARAALDRL